MVQLDLRCHRMRRKKLLRASAVHSRMPWPSAFRLASPSRDLNGALAMHAHGTRPNEPLPEMPLRSSLKPRLTCQCYPPCWDPQQAACGQQRKAQVAVEPSCPPIARQSQHLDCLPLKSQQEHTEPLLRQQESLGTAHQSKQNHLHRFLVMHPQRDHHVQAFQWQRSRLFHPPFPSKVQKVKMSLLRRASSKHARQVPSNARRQSEQERASGLLVAPVDFQK
mmetsp:Transcript_110267/g.173749  ORF Transcript_110267/g.173749 Transcript_110267/m.173749 type:complete len:222 (+) Transcript_110267:1976-2641(+)